METRRMTMAQALIEFLKNQYVERDGRQHQFFAGVLGIFGHGNVAGIGQALQQNPDFPYILVRNEQAGVHMAAGYAKASNRLRTFACTSSIGPGATNMITGAALATINRLPVLLLPGDIFARRNVAPVLQQVESPSTQDIGVNDCFKPVSRYWDRIYRPEQLITALPEVMRVLTSPSDCGAVTLALPQDVQTEAYEYPEELFRKRVWLIRRVQPDQNLFRSRCCCHSFRPPSADRRRRWRADERSLIRRWLRLRSRPVFRLPKLRPARARLPGITPRRWAPSAQPEPSPPIASPQPPIWLSASAPATPISPLPP